MESISVPSSIFIPFFVVLLILGITYVITLYKLTEYIKIKFPLTFAERSVYEFGNFKPKNILLGYYLWYQIVFSHKKLMLDEISSQYVKRARLLLTFILLIFFIFLGYIFTLSV